MRRLLTLIIIMLLIAACGGDSENDNTVNVVASTRNFPTTEPTSFVPTPEPSPTNSFGNVNPTSNCPIPTGWQAYLIRFGDTLGTLADNIGSSVANLQQGNCIATENIFVDQLIFLPSLPAGIPTVDAQRYINTGTGGTTGGFVPTSTIASVGVPASCNAPPGWVAYTVSGGDTLGDLATRTNTTTGNLQNGNCLASPETIFVGQILYLPRVPDTVVVNPGLGLNLTPTPNLACAVPVGWAAYTVRAGDTLGNLATSYNTNVTILQNGNCLASPELIFVGQVLYVPSGSSGVVVTLAPSLTPSGSTQTTPTQATTGGQAPRTLSTLTIRPTLTRTDGVLVTLQQEIALDVGVVTDANRVIYYARTTPTDPNPVQVGQDTDPFDGTQLTYTFNTFDSELYFFAVAQNEFGTSTSPLVRVVYDPTYAVGSGAPDIFPFLGFDGTIYTLQLGATVNINWLNFPTNATRIDFLLVQGAQSSIIISDTNLSDGARGTWQVTGPLTGQIYALATLSNGQTIESSRVFVFVQGTN